MKRKLSLLLAVVMILGSFSFAFAADEVVPAEFLEKEGILVGNDSGDLMLDQPLLRKDAVVLLARLMKAEEEAEAFEKEGLPTFNDLADNPYYKGFLAWAEDNGYFTGKTDGSFGYTDNLEAVEYALVLLRALGYVNDNKADEWDNAWTEAEKLGLLEDVKAERRDEIKREEVAQMTYNALGVTMKDSDKTLAEFLGITMPEADELEVVEVRAENLKEIIVELSNAKLADEEKLENTNNYRLSGNEIERVEVKDNNVLVQVKNTFRNGKEYELQIKGVDKAVDGKYKFVAEDNTIPAVEKVEALGEYGIKVITTEPISNTRSNNFLIDGKNVTMDVEQYGRTIILTPYRGSFDDDAKTLTIKELKDFAGFRSVEEDFDIEIVKDAEAPEVVDAVLKGDTVEVVFDKDIYIDSVGGYYNRSDVGNFSYELGRHTIYADDAKKVDVDTVVYTFKANEVPSRRDEVTIEGVTNHSKEKMEKTTIGLREVLDDVEPEIIDTKITRDTDNRKAKVKLYFDKDVTGSFINKDKEEEGFVVKDHFVLYENEVGARYLPAADGGKIVSAKYDVDEDQDDKLIKDVIVVELADLEIYDRKTNDLEYILEIEGFTNTTSSRYKMFRDYYEFKFTKTTDFVVSSVKVDEVRGETEITITFNKYLDRKEAEDAINYTFYEVKEDGRKVFSDDVADLDGKAELIGNGTKVLLTIPAVDLDEDYHGLRISDAIKDTGGNRLSKMFYFDLGEEKLEEDIAADEAVAAVLAALSADASEELMTALQNELFKNVVADNAVAYFESEEFAALDEDSTVEDINKAIKAVNAGQDVVADEAEKVAAILEAADADALYEALNDAEIKGVIIANLGSYKVELNNLDPETATIKEIQEAIDGANDQAAADEVLAMIADIPAGSNLTLEHADAVAEALEAYNALTDAQKELIDETGLMNRVERIELLKAAAEEAAQLEAIKAAANDIALVKALEEAGIENVLVDVVEIYTGAFGSADDLDAVQGAVDKANATWAMDASFKDNVLTVRVNEDITPAALEVDHSLAATFPEFWVYAAEGDEAYGDADDKEAFETAGVTVIYEDGVWEIDFSGIDDLPEINFYLKVIDADGNEYGSMYNGGYLTVSAE